MHARAAIVAVALLLAMVEAVAAAEAQSLWTAGTLARGRIILARDGLSPAGTIEGAIEIELPAGARTYWAFPGPNGFAPQISRTGSVNLGRFEPGWPAPHLLSEGRQQGAESAGYGDRVVLPFDLAAADPALPVTLALEIELGVCEDICVPDLLVLEMSLVRGTGRRSRHASRVAAALASVPAANGTGELRISGVERSPADGTLVVRAQAHRSFVAPHLFVESLAQDCPTVVAPMQMQAGHARFRVASACPRDGVLAMVLADRGVAIRAKFPIGN